MTERTHTRNRCVLNSRRNDVDDSRTESAPFTELYYYVYHSHRQHGKIHSISHSLFLGGSHRNNTCGNTHGNAQETSTHGKRNEQQPRSGTILNINGDTSARFNVRFLEDVAPIQAHSHKSILNEKYFFLQSSVAPISLPNENP